MNFTNKVVLITGASSGIGAAAAIHLSKLGASTAIVGRNESRLNSVIDEITKVTSTKPLAIIADVAKDASRIIDETIQYFGQLDCLVNNAGIYEITPIATSDISIYDRMMETNCRSIIELTKLAIPHLEKTKGNIVNVSSDAGSKPFKEYYAYCMSKAALDMYTKCAALELGPKGIRVNAINPGVIKTPLYNKSGMSQDEVNQYYEDEKKQYPVGRLGEVSDTSNAISFLASEQSSFINGVTLLVDGGNILY